MFPGGREKVHLEKMGYYEANLSKLINFYSPLKRCEKLQFLIFQEE